MELIPCPICESPIRAEIEKNDALWKDIETVKWARQKGLNISKFSLAKHRTNHLKPISVGDNGDNGNNNDKAATIIEINKSDPSTPPASEPANMIKSNVKKSPKRIRKIEGSEVAIQAQPDKAAAITPSKPAMTDTLAITDQMMLDMVRDRVYQKLRSGEIELDLGDGFKAIEIKHKISEESQNEKLLLEILNEIRAEELKQNTVKSMSSREGSSHEEPTKRSES